MTRILHWIAEDLGVAAGTPRAWLWGVAQAVTVCAGVWAVLVLALST